MSGAPDPWDVAALLAGVHLADEPELATEVAGRLPSPSEPRTVSVTDLLTPRRAFWRRTRGPAPVPLDREVRLEQGRAWHRRLGDAVASDAALEVRVRRGGLSARIDLLADVPVEVKTGPSPADGAPSEEWPDHVEQLAIYCALVGTPVGRLAHLAVRDDGRPVVSVAELRFRDLAGLAAEVDRREAELRAAVAGGRPDRLGRCRWFDAGCEYRSSGVCDCRGDEPTGPSPLVDRLEERRPRPEISVRWTEALASTPAPLARPPAHFRDLLYPRRAYFDRTRGRPPIAHPFRPPSAPLDIYERTIAALERGPVGEVHRLAGGPDAPEEEVLAWRKVPCLVRSSRVRSRLTPDDVRTRFPQYLLDLGFRCAATRGSAASLVVGYEAPGTAQPPVQVFRVDLTRGPEPFASAWKARRAALDGAVDRGSPAGLPSCPAWMATDCPYRDACGCAADAGRSQR